MIVQTTRAETLLKTWIRTGEGTFWIPDQDRPDGFIFTIEPINLDNLSAEALGAWQVKQRERYGAATDG